MADSNQLAALQAIKQAIDRLTSAVEDNTAEVKKTADIHRRGYKNVSGQW